MELEKQALVKALSDLYVSEEDLSIILKEYIEVSHGTLKATSDFQSVNDVIDRERRIHAARRMYFILSS